ncbi:MAG: LysM peptidoglycan-binding domain-containing protein [Rhizobiaceae bacterium]|nr:LysM peptidoglycan-binding domain-containing protein [Rhizobiaceae bacterium]
MAKSLLPILFSSTGVAAAGVAGYFVFVEPNISEEVQQPAQGIVSQTDADPKPEPETQPEEEVASLTQESEPEPEVEAEPEITSEPIVPNFSVLRVEPDGYAVIAGTGPANSEIELFDGDVSIAKTDSDSGGDFAFVLDEPLAPGLHQLNLLAKTQEGAEVASAQAGVVNVPLPEKKEELAVLVTEPGEATRVLTKPAPAPAAEPEPEPEPESVVEVKQSEQEAEPEDEPVAEAEQEIEPVAEAKEEVAKVELGEIASDVSKVEVKTKTEDVAVSIKNSEVAGLQPSAAPIKPVLIEAAEVEGNKLFIAGTGEPGLSVNIYLESELLGRADIAENGAFLFEGERTLSAGKYDIRADMNNTVSGKVVARAEVKLVHEPEVAEVKPEPQTEKPKKTISLLALQGGTAKQVAKPAEPKEAEVAEEPEKAAEPVKLVKEVEEAVEVAKVGETVETDEPVEEVVEEASEEKVIRTGASVIIRRGDNLWRVARRNYGAGIRYTTIFDANRDQIRDPDLIYPGQVFKVPEDNAGETVQDEG